MQEGSRLLVTAALASLDPSESPSGPVYFEEVPGAEVSLSPSNGSKSELGAGAGIGAPEVYLEEVPNLKIN